MIKSLFTADQIQDLREEFVNFKLSDMTSEDLVAFAKDVMLKDVNVLNEDQLRNEIDDYDENLYEILAPYVLDEQDSHEALQEFIHDRHATEWIYD